MTHLTWLLSSAAVVARTPGPVGPGSATGVRRNLVGAGEKLESGEPTSLVSPDAWRHRRDRRVNPENGSMPRHGRRYVSFGSRVPSQDTPAIQIRW